MRSGIMTATRARDEGRRPVKAATYRGWTVEVYRVGRRHEYQGLAIGPDGVVLMAPRSAGPQAMAAAGLAAASMVDQALMASRTTND